MTTSNEDNFKDTVLEIQRAPRNGQCETLNDLTEAKQSFVELMRSLRKTDQRKFLAFIVKEWQLEPLMADDYSEDDVCGNDEARDDAKFFLNSIAYDIKQEIPFEGILPSENFVKPSSGENSDCDPNVTLSLDMFLYNEEDVDVLVEDGQIQKYYCVNCGSRSIQPLITISHSISQEHLYFIFNMLLPKLKGKTVLDVGSRLGAVLYGAYVYTKAEKIIGVEMNEEFCNLQKDIVHKYKMDHRISIIHNRIEDIPEIIEKSDVIIINNPFEFYLPQDVHINIWEYLKNTIKQGTILVTRPSVETSFKTLRIKISIKKWLKPLQKIHSNKFSAAFDMIEKDCDDIKCYEVL